MFENRITALHQIENKVQFLTVEISDQGWRILECGNLNKAQLKSHIGGVSHFMSSWRTEFALSLRQDNVLYKSIPCPEQADPWWIEQQVEEVLRTRNGTPDLICDYSFYSGHLALFLCEKRTLESIRASIEVDLDIVGWQITDVISLCKEYNQYKTLPIEGYIDTVTHQYYAVSFTFGIRIFKAGNKEHFLSEVEGFFKECGTAQVLTLGKPLVFSQIQSISLNELWQKLGQGLDVSFYPSLACALGALRWKRGGGL